MSTARPPEGAPRDAGFRLVPCERDGAVALDRALPPEIREACLATAGLYRRVGFQPPWVGYVAVLGDEAVGGGAFVGAPLHGRVEIAYYTLAARQREGIAGRTARRLVGIAQAARPGVEIFAKTLPRENPSTRILRSLGFEMTGTAADDGIGTAWAWLLR
ncbi:GNAT family N-acetyltransferase [Pseudorhodoferax sp.]|uniref:GNAT family N-acetyltransferase n=1 Tax=Pseudorhodoferax sp. TaxID=1993553 RepID=UPI002DD696A6|nr:hypothetical protein [Pseudorhodoferax sp.]